MGKAPFVMIAAIIAGGIAQYAVGAWLGQQAQFVSIAYPAAVGFFFVHQACRSWPLAVAAAWLVIHEWLGKSLPAEQQWHLVPSLLAFAIASELVETHWAKKAKGKPAAA
jgi:hypothetical protein